MKVIYRLLLFVFAFAFYPVHAQDQMSQHKKERKKLWRRWNKKRDAYNPYLSKKGKNKPSARMARGEKKEIKRQKRDYKRQLKHARK